MVKQIAMVVVEIVKRNLYAVVAGGSLLIALPLFFRLLDILKMAQGK